MPQDDESTLSPRHKEDILKGIHVKIQDIYCPRGVLKVVDVISTVNFSHANCMAASLGRLRDGCLI